MGMLDKFIAELKKDRLFGESFLRELRKSRDLRKALYAEWSYFKGIFTGWRVWISWRNR